MKKPYENKTQQYDPGRFRYDLSFYNQVTIDDGSGGSIVTLQFAHSTRAVKEVFPKRVNQDGQLIVQGGATSEDDIWYFVTRYNRSFTANKAMNIVYNGLLYSIHAIIEVDVPINYIKYLCVNRDDASQFLTGGDGYFYVYENDPNITIVDGKFTYTNPSLSGVVKYSVYAEQNSAFFIESDLQINPDGGFTILTDGFELIPNYRLIVFVKYIGEV